MKRLGLFFALALLAGCGGGGGGGSSNSNGGPSVPDTPVVINTAPSTTVNTTGNTHVITISFDASGCILNLAEPAGTCTKGQDVTSIVWTSDAVGFGANSIAQASLDGYPIPGTANITIPHTLDTTDQGGWSVLKKDGTNPWFNADKVICTPACTKVTTASGGKFLRYGTYPGIGIAKANGQMTMTWGTKVLWGFLQNGKPAIFDATGVQGVFFGSDQAGWPTNGSTAVALLTVLADGTTKATFSYVPAAGEHGNFYAKLLDGTVVWLNLGLGPDDLHCVGCSINSSTGQVTFN